MKKLVKVIKILIKKLYGRYFSRRDHRESRLNFCKSEPFEITSFFFSSIYATIISNHGKSFMKAISGNISTSWAGLEIKRELHKFVEKFKNSYGNPLVIDNFL